MRITHRIPVREMKSDPITPEYQSEVDRSTERLDRDYARAQRRMAAAARRAERLVRLAVTPRPRGHRVKAKEIEAAWAEVEMRRQELAAYQRLMAAAGASTQHRGRDSYRPVPVVQGELL